MTPQKRAIVLGGYGLIGAACIRALRFAGFAVIGVGRSRTAAVRAIPDIKWRILDLNRAGCDQLAQVLADADVVINAAGALQDGLKDDVTAIHETMITHLVGALEGRQVRVIQISAAGVSADASTQFFRSKARGDRILMSSRLDWVVLRPVLVFSAQAYGGTALLRANAAMPLIGFSVFPETKVQTVSIDDVTGAVVAAARGDIASRTLADLTEPDAQSFADLVDRVRGWLGLPAWRIKIPAPPAMLRLVALFADALGRLGWRSPFRSTALTILSQGIRGDPTAWSSAGGAPCRTLQATLSAIPATSQERWFARLYLLMPVIIATLALFWLLSGLIGLARNDEATAVLASRGFSPESAVVLVRLGAAVDIVLGGLILVRRFARTASLGMAAMSLAYLAGATLFTADLWLDPLGPLLKAVPAFTLALVAAAILDER